MISLACQIFSVQPHSACVLLQSSVCCPLHVQTISSYWCGAPHLKSWMPSFVRRESELTSSFALTLQIQRIMARSLRRRRFSVSTFMAQVSAACSITLLTHDEYTLPLVRRGRWWLVRRGSNWRNLPHAHLQRVIPATSCRQHVPKVAEVWDNFKLFFSNLNLWNFSFINSPSSPKASGAPELRVRAQGSLNATAFLMHPALAATTEDCIRATNSWLTDTTGVLSRFLQPSQINARHHSLCLPHVQVLCLHLYLPCLHLYQQFLHGLSTDHQVVCVQQLPLTACAELPG